MVKKYFKKIGLFLSLSLCLNASLPAFARSGQEILSLGGNLTSAQEKELREYFKVSDDFPAIYVTSKVAAEQFGYGEDYVKNNIGGWYSSAYIKITKGDGIKVTADKFTLVTEDMLVNALITSSGGRVSSAEIIASCPKGMSVTGESALAGILAGVESVMGQSLDQTNKEVAQEEIETTVDVADEIGDKEASIIMNEIKSEIIKDSNITQNQISQIVINITNNYGVELSEETQEKVINTMRKINELDINYDDVEESLKDVTSDLIDKLKESVDNGEEVKLNIDKLEKDFKASLGFLKNMWNSICNWFSSLYNSIVSLFDSENQINENVDDTSNQLSPENSIDTDNNVELDNEENSNDEEIEEVEEVQSDDLNDNVEEETTEEVNSGSYEGNAEELQNDNIDQEIIEDSLENESTNIDENSENVN